MNILISGGAGFIGSSLAIKLIERGHSVRVMDCLSEQIHGRDPEITSPLYQSILGKVDFLRGTVVSRQDWRTAIKGIEVIIHLAAETGTGQSMYDIERYTHINIGGTSILLDLLANEQHNVRRVVVASSRAIYGEGKYYSEELGYVYPPHRRMEDMQKGDFEVKMPGSVSPLKLLATDEDSKIHPSSVYGITKQNQEQIIMNVCPAIGIEPVAFRYQNVYGPGQSLSNPYTGILSIFSTRIRNANPIKIFEDGKESRDFVFIDDVVEATVRGVEREAAAMNIFNVGYGAPTNVMTVARVLIDLFGSEIPLEITGNFRVGDIRHNYADLTKIQSVLGYHPKFDFHAGAQRFVEWVKDQSVSEDLYNHSITEMQKRGLYK